MDFRHEFRIPLPIDEALAVLTDLEQVAPCMPGATLESVDGDTYSGRVKVKVGPMSLTYSGDATVASVDHDARTARIEASGREKRGSGTASADVDASLVEDGDGTMVTVTTDINITGKPAQFGRGVMADVGEKIIQRFADNLQAQLQDEQAEQAGEEAADTGTDPDGDVDVAAPDATETPAAVAASSGPRQVQQRAPRDEALDILDVAGDTTAAKVVPLVLAAALALVVLLVVRRRRDGG